MKEKKLKKFFEEWDSDSFDLVSEAMGELHKNAVTDTHNEKPITRPDLKLERKEVAIFSRSYRVIVVILFAVLIFFLMRAVIGLPAFGSAEAPAHNEVMQRYVEQGMAETGAVNTVAGVILDYRAFDTLGESHVLYTALTAVLILLLSPGKDEDRKDNAAASSADEDKTANYLRYDRIVVSTARVIVPVVIMFGIYIITNGHLGPGGGFAGGATIGAGLILYAIAFGFERISRYLNIRSFRIIVLCALCFYSLSKCYSFFCGANELESGIQTGIPGHILSGGLILPLNVAVGIVVACTMYGLYSIFKRGRI